MRWNSRVDGSSDVVDETHQDNLPEFSIPGTRSHGDAERALDRGVNDLGHCSLPVEIVVDSGVVGVIVGGVETMLD